MPGDALNEKNATHYFSSIKQALLNPVSVDFTTVDNACHGRGSDDVIQTTHEMTRT